MLFWALTVTQSTNSGKQKRTSNQTATKTKVYMKRPQNTKTSSIKTDRKTLDTDEILQNTTPVDNKTNNKIPKSVLTKNYVSTGHTFNDKDLTILLSNRNQYRLLIKESLLIRQREPKLNGTDRSIPLHIHLDEIRKNTTKTSNQAARASDIHIDIAIVANISVN